MKLDKSELIHLANLSKLHFTDSELEKLSKDFESIIEFANEINAYSGDCEIISNFKTVEDLREDVVENDLTKEKILSNAPDSRKGCFVVPRIME